MSLGRSGEDYLEAILILYQKTGCVHSVDVANYMNFSKPSICHAVKELRKKGYLQMNDDGSLLLTEKGTLVAEKIYERHRFFTQQLILAGVDPVTAEKDACEIEHIISDASYERLKEIYGKST